MVQMLDSPSNAISDFYNKQSGSLNNSVRLEGEAIDGVRVGGPPVGRLEREDDDAAVHLKGDLIKEIVANCDNVSFHPNLEILNSITIPMLLSIPEGEAPHVGAHSAAVAGGGGGERGAAAERERGRGRGGGRGALARLHLHPQQGVHPGKVSQVGRRLSIDRAP